MAGQTLAPGSSAAMLSNTPISIAPGGLAAIMGTSTQILATLSSPAELTFAGSTYTADSITNIYIAGQTLKPGKPPIIISGTAISLAPGGAAAVIGTSIQLLSIAAPNHAESAPTLVVGGSTYHAHSTSQFVIGSQTLTPGGSIIVSGTTLSLDSGASIAMIDGSTKQLSPAIATPEPIITFAGSTYTGGASSDFFIAGQTLEKGGAITVNGVALSYDQKGTAIVIGTSTELLSTAIPSGTEAPVFTFEGSTFNEVASSDFIIDGQTLTKGGVVTVDGTPISFGAAGTDVVVGSSTEPVGLAGYIMSGFGSGPTNTSAPFQFLGKANRTILVPTMVNIALAMAITYLFS